MLGFTTITRHADRSASQGRRRGLRLSQGAREAIAFAILALVFLLSLAVRVWTYLPPVAQ